MDDDLARILFAAIWLPFAAMRIYYIRLGGAEMRPVYSRWEGRGFAFVRVFLALPWMAFLLVWLVRPSTASWASFALAAPWRWLGAGLLAAGALLVFWVNRTLGRNFSGSLALRSDHRLVQEGPYRRVRHPMYPGFLAMTVGMLLLSANWMIGVPPILGVLYVMAVRTPREEAMLIDRFGDEYRRYRERTGRFVPRISA
ncbi:MAG TPA: isoprenylcysteine carboxylmethyltransferase family protein [Thermoanaerobaculia bacterium]|nr:isoprenylcysteine carboxylmethyltransferase family protein [Thermoanaerobaculia bacterium]